MKYLTLSLILLLQVSCQKVSDIKEGATDSNIEQSSTVEESGLVSSAESLEDLNCPMVYEPVCARVSKNKDCKDERFCEFIDKTYSSECFANIDNAQVQYLGECAKEDGKEVQCLAEGCTEEPVKLKPIDKDPEIKFCYALYDPVCGKSPDKLGTEKTYSNMCYLETAGAEFLRYGACDKESLKM